MPVNESFWKNKNIDNRVISDTLKGIIWMCACTLLFVLVTVIVRYVGTNVPAPQAAFLRYVFGLLLVLPLLPRILKAPPSRKVVTSLVFRGMLHSIAVTLWFFAMARIPIAEVTAIGYLTPLFVTIAAVLFLGEKIHLPRVIAIIIGFIGTLIILRPGFQSVSIGQYAQLLTTPLFALSFILVKINTKKTSPEIIIFMLSLICTLALLPGALLDWREPTMNEYILLFFTAIGATLGHYAMTRAFIYAPLSVTEPLRFLSLIWATILGYVLFNEQVDVFVILGGSIVVGSVVFIAHREARLSKLAKKVKKL